MALSKLAAALAAAALCCGCVLLIDDPSDWSVSPTTSSNFLGGGGSLQCYGSDSSCSCEPSDYVLNSATCSAEALPESICCADLDYPKANSNCGCRRLSCKRDLQGCTCTDGTSHGSSASCLPQAGETCCRSSSGCRCGAGGCGSDAKVARCDQAVLACDNQIAVETCAR
jgi:hypothetical protein